jgi:hypothetical protein
VSSEWGFLFVWPSETLLAYPISTEIPQYFHRKTPEFHPAGLFFVAMTLYEFNTLPHGNQLLTVIGLGTFLAVRWEEKDHISLYHLPGGVFVEIHYDTHLYQVVHLRSFTSAAPLENYTLSIELPEVL